MSSTLMNPVQYFFIINIFMIISVTSLHTVKCVDFDVGGDQGWVTPSKNRHFYNDWASNNRFQVNDTLRFLYKEDSVMGVSEEEYEKCGSLHPMFFANNGNTIFRLTRPGLFYFISGVSGHCHKGLNLIVKVLEPDSPPQQNKSAGATAAFAFPWAVSSLVVGISLFV